MEMTELWVCRKGWNSRHQRHHHLHRWESPTRVQDTDSCSGYWASWGEGATEVGCGQSTEGYGVMRRTFSFSFRPKGYLSLSCNPWALNHRRYWETTHLVTGQRVQFSWVGPQHLAHEASQIWQWPCSSMYSPGEENLVVYLISTCQCCVGC